MYGYVWRKLSIVAIEIITKYPCNRHTHKRKGKKPKKIEYFGEHWRATVQTHTIESDTDSGNECDLYNGYRVWKRKSERVTERRKILLHALWQTLNSALGQQAIAWINCVFKRAFASFVAHGVVFRNFLSNKQIHTKLHGKYFAVCKFHRKWRETKRKTFFDIHWMYLARAFANRNNQSKIHKSFFVCSSVIYQ